MRDFPVGTLCRPPFGGRIRPEWQWGTLGSPSAAEGTRLLHLFRTPRTMLRYAFYAPGAEVPHHTHAHASFVYGDGGPCRELGVSSSRSVGRLTYRPAGYCHALRYEGPTHVLAIEILEDAGPLPELSIGLPATLYDEIWKALTAVALHLPTEIIDEAVAALVAKTRSLWLAPYPDWLIAALDRIHREWESSPSAAALARAAGLSTAYFCRGFKRSMGVTTRQYGLMLRADRARHLLWSTDAPLSQVAADSGFADQSHLCRVLAASAGHSRPGWLRAIRPDRLEPHRCGKTEARKLLRGTGFVGLLA